MTLDQIIALFEDIESGTENQRIGFHLHANIRQASTQTWPTNASYEPTFSGFLKAMKDSPPPSSLV